MAQARTGGEQEKGKEIAVVKKSSILRVSFYRAGFFRSRFLC